MNHFNQPAGIFVGDVIANWTIRHSAHTCVERHENGICAAENKPCCYRICPLRVTGTFYTRPTLNLNKNSSENQ